MTDDKLNSYHAAETDDEFVQRSYFVDELSGTDVVIVKARQNRPNIEVESCPFCPGGLEAPKSYDVYSFANRWPSLGKNRCEVILYSPEHNSSLFACGKSGILKVVELWGQRTKVLFEFEDVQYVLIFENSGKEVGATIMHPHGQIYAFDRIPKVPLNELCLAKKKCQLCKIESPERTLFSNTNLISFVPIAPTFPFEVIISTRSHVHSLLDFNDSFNQDLAEQLEKVLGAFQILFEEPMPYMMWIHQGPIKSDLVKQAHFHIHIVGIWRDLSVQRYVAAGELGSGVMFNPIDPLDAATRLKRVMR